MEVRKFLVAKFVTMTSRPAAPAAITACVLAVGLQIDTLGWHAADRPFDNVLLRYGNIAIACIIWAPIIFVLWFFRRKVRLSLQHTRQVEHTLRQQKIVRQKIKKRSDQIRQVQLEELQQMYRFAELGQFGVRLLHELANQLTSLQLEIDGMQHKLDDRAITRTREIAGYLEGIVNDTRSRLHGDTKKQTFNIIREIGEVISFLDHKAAKANVVIEWQPPTHPLRYAGDATGFSQVMTILVSNAIDAYSNIPVDQARANRLVILMQHNATHIIVTVSDWGVGISKVQRKQLFKPFHTSKKTGLGLGLFMAQQTVAANLGGTLTLNPTCDHTEFIIKLPIQPVP